MRPTTTAPATSTYAGIDLTSARKLADLISASVAHLEALSLSHSHSQSSNAPSESADKKDVRGEDDDERDEKKDEREVEVEEAKAARTPMLTIVAAAGQLLASIRPPSVVAVEVATSVRPSLLPVSNSSILTFLTLGGYGCGICIYGTRKHILYIEHPLGGPPPRRRRIHPGDHPRAFSPPSLSLPTSISDSASE